MNTVQRTSWLVVLTCGVVGLAVGLLTQFSRSAFGSAPIVLPYTLSVTLLVIAALVLTLAVLLRRTMSGSSQRVVNPFHAVRILAAARASQFAGGLFAGFGIGLLLPLLGRTVPAPVSTWLPLLIAGIAGVLLLGIGAIAEQLCKVPPADPKSTQSESGSSEQLAAD